MYDQIAYYYDLTHQNLTEDIPFVLSQAAAVGGEILELGCGSGRLLLPLARAGYTVIGLDNSEAMLERARTQLAQEETAVQERVTLVTADMIGFQLPHQFALIIIPFNTLLHVKPNQIGPMLRTINRHLAPHGRLLIDTINPFYIADAPDTEEPELEDVFEDAEKNWVVEQWSRNWLIVEDQVFFIEWVFKVFDHQQNPITSDAVQIEYYYYLPHQLQLHLENAGFEPEQLWGDYDGSPFDEEAPRLLSLSKKVA